MKAISLGMMIWLSLPLSLSCAFLRCVCSPCQIPDGSSGTPTSWETHHPGPVSPPLQGARRSQGRMCNASGSSICYFHRCLPLVPQPPLLSDPMLSKVPQTSQAFSFPPAALLASSRYSPSSPLPSAVLERLPLTSISILASPGSLLLRSSYHFLRLWRKVMTGNAELSLVRITDSQRLRV